VCPPADAPWGRRLPTSRTLARWQGWVHITCPGAAAHQRLRFRPPRTRPAGPSRPTNPSTLRLRINVYLFTYQPRTVPARLPRSRAGSTVRCGTLVSGRLYDPWQDISPRPRQDWVPQEFEVELRREPRQASTPVDGADRGNQPIYRRVDTISKQYDRQDQHKQYPARQYPLSTTSGMQDGSSDGGGAPWES
jgi:hypothetical protein